MVAVVWLVIGVVLLAVELHHQSEGNQQSAINIADGAPKAAIRAAEGRAQAIASVYDAIKPAAPDPSVIAILQLEPLGKFADSDNTKIVVPYESAALLGAARALRSVMDAVPSA